MSPEWRDSLITGAEDGAVETLEKQVRRARRRLLAESLYGRLAWCWFLALLAAALAIGAGKLWTPVGQQAWAAGWLAAAIGGGLASAILWSWARRQSALEAAVEIDRRFGLKERVSSTLALAPVERATPIGQALARDAEQSIRPLDVAEQFRVRVDRRALLPLAPAALAFALAVFVPVRVPEAPAQNAVAERSQTKASTKILAKKLAQRRKEAAEKGLKEMDPLLAKLEQGAKKLTETSQDDRKKTLLALNDLVKDAEQRRQELAGAGDLKKQLANLKNFDEGPAEKLGQALKNGDLDEAIKQIGKLKQQLADEKLDEAGKKALAKQLDQLQQALEQQAHKREEMARQLKEQIEARRRAGDLAQADQLQQQLDKLAGQKAQMDKLGQMQQQLKAAAECMGKGDCEQAAAALAELGEELAGMQEDMQEMEMLEEALDQVAECKKAMACKACNGEGCEACQGEGEGGADGEWNKHDGEFGRQRHRGGGKGIGVGLGPGLGPETNPDAKFYDSAVKQQPGQGAAKVVGEADGPNRKGRVQEEIQTEFSAADQQAADALGEQRLPREYRDHAQKYFDALREGTR